MTIKNFTPEQIAELKAAGSSSGSIRTDGSWGSAPRISSNSKVTAPSRIKASHEGDEAVEIRQVRGPSPDSVDAGARREAEERALAAEEADARATALAEASPEKVLARLAWAERAISRLQKRINQLEKNSDA